MVMKRISNDLLEEIIEHVGSYAIEDCRPYETVDGIMYDVTFSNLVCLIYLTAGINIIKGDGILFVDRCRYSEVNIL